MERKFSSILDELTSAPLRNQSAFIESHGQQVIASVNNLISLIRETYEPDTAADLTKRLINSIRTGDEDKFLRGMKGMKRK